MHIAIDAMGGEGGVSLTVPAALQALQTFPELLLTLVGNEDQIGPLLPRNPQFQTLRLSILNTPDVISETDKPGNVIRNGKNSSMYLAAGLLRRGEVQAMVSAGNTGALIMIGRHLIKIITGIQKINDPNKIKELFKIAMTTDSLEEFAINLKDNNTRIIN